jgi:hypothetical protein
MHQPHASLKRARCMIETSRCDQSNRQQDQGSGQCNSQMSDLLVTPQAFRDDGQALYLENFAAHSMQATDADLASLPSPSLFQVVPMCMHIRLQFAEA